MAIPKISIKEFAEIVDKERSIGSYFVSGLVIRKKGSSPNIKKIASALPENVIIEISKKIDDQKIAPQIKSAFENKKWLVFHLSDGFLPPLWREQFMRLRNSNSIFIQGKAAEDTFFSEQPAEARIVAVIDDKNIKNTGYPQFLNLFGPVIEI